MKDKFRRLLVVILALAVGVCFSVLTLKFGWGLEPKSWVWILILGPIGSMVALAIMKLADDDK